MSKTPDKKPLKVTSFNLPEDQIAFLGVESCKLNRSRSNYLQEIISEAMRPLQKKPASKR